MRYLFHSAASALATLVAAVPPLPAMQQDSSTARPTIGLDVRTVIEPDTLDRATFSSLAELLQARVPGLSVTRRGDGSVLLHMRGPSSVHAENSPLLVIDDVRISLARPRLEEFVGRPSPLDDIDVEHVERVEVIAGPATGILYGTGAANGVIRVTTREARVTPTRWRFFAGAGAIDEPVTYPANTSRLGTWSSGATWTCTRVDEENGRCTPTGNVTSFNPLEEEAVLHTAPRTRIGASVSSGSELISWTGGATVDHEGSVMGGTKHLRAHVRGAARVQLSPGAHLVLRTHWSDGTATLGNTTEQSLRRQALLHPGLPTPWPGFLRDVEPQLGLSRRGVSLSAAWRAASWLSGSIVTGVDRSSGTDRVEITRDLGPSTALELKWVRQFRNDFTGQARIEARYGSTDRLHGRSGMLVDLNESRRMHRRDDETHFEGGVSTWMIQMRNDEDVIGVGASQEFSFGDRALMRFAIRYDDLRNFDLRWKTPWYPHASLVWVAARDDAGLLGSVRLRAAYGKGGSLPSYDSFQFVPLPPGQRPVLDRRAEVTSEREAGIDATFVNRRARASVTWYAKRTRDVLIDVPIPMFGTALNRGVEASLSLHVLRGSRAKWDLRAGFAHNHNELTTSLSDAGYGFLTPVIGFASRQIIRHGAPLGAYLVNPVVSAVDADGDGFLESACLEPDPNPCEVRLRQERETRIAFPPTEASLESVIRLGSVRVGLLIDHRRGHYLHNQTEAFRCVMTCADAYATSLSGDHAVRIATTDAALHAFVGSFVENATFTKLREVSVRFEAPAAWASRFSADGLQISLAGRNLATWTRYSGIDPEASSHDDNGLVVGDLASAPLPRSFVLRVSLTR